MNIKKYVVHALGGVMKADFKEPSPLVILDMVVDPHELGKAIGQLTVPANDNDNPPAKPIVLQMCANVLPDVGLVRMLNLSNGTDYRQFGDPDFIKYVLSLEKEKEEVSHE